jgi:ribosomal protein S18 acetylase RimI-like enzyme
VSASLRPLRADEYADWLAKTKEGYVRSMVDEAGVAADVAREKADRDHDALLTAGLATPDHFIFAVEAGGEVVGSLWLAARGGGDLGASMFVYSVAVDETHRGRGYGRDAMRLAEEEARARGFDSVTLNVFGGNEVARGLYTSLGYREQAVFMRKDL